ncbi:bifunctional 4-hydroxy-3-methylbut-2-enyl diphosphate reductase/30S ribosomal protein S1 [Clostridium gasigenes]|uniref:bifunctional 4-hydroxy-3-methylbut-2-enyl diphosphate reductase/30S ribosomal protein S1 n=1 Tax=Clostridium gasigenes TaxID=94869 RepID=UPI001C0E0AFD|nr:bifunctional 4-hydroxy-3-methylbut-2-enyl diphosphate reductase/30S ribosomal protein S1 [Clostridium gasigenes]MBU3087444.1 bifunctional 4-hydroxy-3-methylbut-2-enyl diphosphate reductase/30S ribosomal protein S1 [Clostridium gasigenes]
MKNIILAECAGFCFGVQRAVEEALKIKKQANKRIYTLGPLIHNNDVVRHLEENDIYAIEFNKLDELVKGDVIVVRSHGVSKDVMKTLENYGFEVFDATCPYVTNIQKKVNKYSNLGYSIVILGDNKHPEVVGINGWCDNKAIITTDGSFKEAIPNKICAVSQTTEKKDNWDTTLKNISSSCKELLAFNTICSATEVRQKSANELSKLVDTMIVIGGKNSSNTTKLYEIAKNNCENTIHIENSNELTKEFIENNNFNKIGVTAGASTPDWIIKEVIDIMEGNFNMEDQLKLMDELDRKFCIGDEVEGEILSIGKDEVVVSLVGYKSDGVIPFSELTILKSIEEAISELHVSDSITAKVIKLQNEDRNVVLSRLEYEKDIALNELETLFNNKDTFNLTIKEAKEKGLVAYYKGVRIFIPASQIDSKFTNSKIEFVGEIFEVKLIDFSRQNPSKIIASRRIIIEAKETIKENAIWDNISIDDILKAQIKRFTKFGAFAEVNGVDGLIHLSQISWNHVKSPEDVLKKGDIVDVKVIDMDRDNKKLSLSIKALLQEPWANVEEKYPEGSVVLGKVVRLNDFGAFVELEPGIDGLVHISKISHDRVNNPSDVLFVSQEIKAKILTVDKANRKIGLSMKDVE